MLVYREGEKQVGKTFIFFVLRRPGQGRKFGFAVTRKVGCATVRNRIKRYIREVYRKHRGALDDNASMVIVARPAAVGLGYLECEQAIRRLFQKGDVLHG